MNSSIRSTATNGEENRLLVVRLGAATAIRLLVNTTRRFSAPFAAALSRGLGVPLASITTVIAANSATSALSPLFGPLGDRYGYRVMMIAGMGVLTVGMLTGGLLPSYATVMLALFLAGLSKGLFDPALQAYVGENVPYHRRGLAIGLIEYGWSGTTLLGIPLIGLLIERQGWRAPFVLMGVLGALSILVVWWLFPPENVRTVAASPHTGLGKAWRRLTQERAALGAVAFTFLLSAASNNLFFVYGAWLEDTFGLSIAGVGLATMAIGGAEILGETLTASLSDRLGLKRAIIVGAILSTASYVTLPLLGSTLPLALTALFLIYLCFEFTMVTGLSLYTELLPDARGTMTSASIGALGLGGVAGTLLSGQLWGVGGLPINALTSTLLSACALLALVWGLRRWQAPDQEG